MNKFLEQDSTIEIVARKKTKGRVRWFAHEMAYGFITEDGYNTDIFMHYTAIQAPGFRSIRPGQRVVFERCTTSKGYLVAQHVVPVLEG